MAQDCKLAGQYRLTFLCCNMKGFPASCSSLYDFSTLNTTAPHNLIKDKLTVLIEQILIESSLYLICNEKRALSLLNNLNDIIYCHVIKVLTLSTIFWAIYL